MPNGQFVDFLEHLDRNLNEGVFDYVFSRERKKSFLFAISDEAIEAIEANEEFAEGHTESAESLATPSQKHHLSHYLHALNRLSLTFSAATLAAGGYQYIKDTPERRLDSFVKNIGAPLTALGGVALVFTGIGGPLGVFTAAGGKLLKDIAALALIDKDINDAKKQHDAILNELDNKIVSYIQQTHPNISKEIIMDMLINYPNVNIPIDLKDELIKAINLRKKLIHKIESEIEATNSERAELLTELIEDSLIASSAGLITMGAQGIGGIGVAEFVSSVIATPIGLGVIGALAGHILLESIPKLDIMLQNTMNSLLSIANDKNRNNILRFITGIFYFALGPVRLITTLLRPVSDMYMKPWLGIKAIWHSNMNPLLKFAGISIISIAGTALAIVRVGIRAIKTTLGLVGVTGYFLYASIRTVFSGFSGKWFKNCWDMFKSVFTEVKKDIVDRYNPFSEINKLEDPSKFKSQGFSKMVQTGLQKEIKQLHKEKSEAVKFRMQNKKSKESAIYKIQKYTENKQNENLLFNKENTLKLKVAHELKEIISSENGNKLQMLHNKMHHKYERKAIFESTISQSKLHDVYQYCIDHVLQNIDKNQIIEVLENKIGRLKAPNQLKKQAALTQAMDILRNFAPKDLEREKQIKEITRLMHLPEVTEGMKATTETEDILGYVLAYMQKESLQHQIESEKSQDAVHEDIHKTPKHPH